MMKARWLVFLLAGAVASAAVAADRNWTGKGSDANWSNPQNWENNAPPTGNDDVVYFPAGTPLNVTVDASATVKTVYFRNPGMVLAVAAGQNLHFNNGGSLTIHAAEDATIEGPGTITFSTGGGTNWADNQAAAGKTLLINAQITGANGFEHNGTGGTIVLNNSANDQQGVTSMTAAGILSFPSIANAGVACALGAGTDVLFNNGPAYYLYTGGAVATDRNFLHIANASVDVVFRHAGTGTVTLNGPCRSGNDNSHAFVMMVDDPASAIDIAGTYYNGGTAALWLYKRGAGTLRVSSAATHTGNTVVEQGTLEVTPSGSIGSGSLVRLLGGRLLYTGNVNASLGTVQVENALSTIELVPENSGSSTLTMAALNNSSSAIDFKASDLGGATKIFISNMSSGIIGSWATVNGGADLAAYSTTLGVIPANLPATSLAALGTSVILDDANKASRIDSAGPVGLGDGITLEKSVTETALLAQEVATPAVVTFGGDTLVTPLVQIALGKADLTLGAAAGDGTLLAPASSGYRLYLKNANAAGGAALTVNAAVANNGPNALRIDKSGPGDVALAGPITHTGGTIIGGEGSLTVSNATDLTWPAGGISGNGGLVKDGDGTLYFPNTANTYGGTTVVSRGVVSILHSDTFGTKTAPTVVMPGGAIDFIGTLDQSLQLNTEEIYAGGAGPNNGGALRNSGAYSQYNAIRFLTLTDDLTVNLSGNRLDVRNSGGNAYMNFNGHGITKKGSKMFGLTNVTATNDQGTAFIDIQEGSFTIEVGTTLSGSSANYMRIAGNGAFFDIYNISSPINWSLLMEDGARVNTRAGYGQSLNVWAGPVTLNGTATFESAGTLSDTFSGNITGTGSVIKKGSNEHGVTYLRGVNTWTGGARVESGILYAESPDALPGYDTQGIQVFNRGTLAVRIADTANTKPGFSLTDIDTLLYDGFTFQSTVASIGFDTAYEDFNFSALFPQIGIRKFGANKLTLSGAGTDIGPVGVYGGALDLSPANRYLGENNIVVGLDTSTTVPLAELIVGGQAQILSTNKGNQVSGQPQTVIGDTGRGVMRVSGNAMVNGRLLVGNIAGSAGAVYQTGGVMDNTGGHSNDGRIGVAGYGYYLLADGVFTNRGYTQLGSETAGCGIVQQTGGELVFTAEHQGNFSLSRGGRGVVYTDGGTMRIQNALMLIENSGANGNAAFTVKGNSKVYVNNQIQMGDHNNCTAILNLNGGEVNATRIRKGDRTSNLTYVNWDGGLFRATSADAQLFYGENTAPCPIVTLYDGGAFIDIPDVGKNKTVSTPLRAPEGLGLISIPVASGGAGYLGSPAVVVTGGSGGGGSAFAHIENGAVTSIEITSPGEYYATPAVTLSGGGAATAATLGTPVIGVVASGGLTKLGGGKLALDAANTYRGPTEIRDGLLQLAANGTIPPSSHVILTGGSLDLGGKTLANGNVTATAGSILNGRISAEAINKTGDGTLILGTPVALGPSAPAPVPLTAGLWEGMIGAAWDVATAAPKSALQMTTRAANGGKIAANGTYAGGLWNGNNHTYTYSGFIWNHSEQNVDWTFFGRFNDNMYLLIDGKTPVRATDAAEAYATVTLSPGPHLFEARFGDASGDCGPGPSTRTALPTSGPMAGLLVDYSGAAPVIGSDGLVDLTNFQILEDPGDGSLFTLEAPGYFTEGPGLSEYVIPQSWNTANQGLLVSRQLTTRAGNGRTESNATYAGGLWNGGNHTWIYKGILWNREGTDVTWRWRIIFDDNVRLTIDGTVILEGLNNNQTVQYANTVLSDGPHTIEIRFGDGTGSAGAASGLGGLTYTSDPSKLASTDANDFFLLQDPGDGERLTTDLATGQLWGQPQPPTPPEPPPAEIATVNVAEGTLRLLNNPAAGLWEGIITEEGVNHSFNTTTPNPEDCIELTTTAANGYGGQGESINGKPWPTNTTYVYSGYIWNRSQGDVTWTFAKNFDDSVLLLIDKKELIRNGGWQSPMVAPVTLSPGAHEIEIRFGQGTGGAGGNVAGWWTDRTITFGIDFQGRTGDDATNLANYVYLKDPGDGSLLTWTLDDAGLLKEELLDGVQVNLGDTAVLDLAYAAHKVGVVAGTGTVSNGTLATGSVISPAGDDGIGTLAFEGVTLAQGITYRLTTDGAASDCITSTGTLDLSGITIVPAPGWTPTASTYLIAHADGGITGTKPVLSGFPSKYIVAKKANDIILVSGGTLIILR